MKQKHVKHKVKQENSSLLSKSSTSSSVHNVLFSFKDFIIYPPMYSILVETEAFKTNAIPEAVKIKKTTKFVSCFHNLYTNIRP